MSKSKQMPNRKSHPRQIRLFQNEFLEKLTVLSPAAFGALWCGVLPLVLWSGWGTASPLNALVLFVTGLASWAIFEYALHRYLFHWNPQVQIFRFFVYLMHGNHHADPGNPMRSLMPPVVSLPIAGAVWALCVALIGLAGTWAFLGFILGYVIYDLTHYACHQWVAKGRIAALLKRHHMRHHHVDQERNFAITAIFLDRAFGSLITPLKHQG